MAIDWNEAVEESIEVDDGNSSFVPDESNVDIFNIQNKNLLSTSDPSFEKDWRDYWSSSGTNGTTGNQYNFGNSDYVVDGRRAGGVFYSGTPTAASIYSLYTTTYIPLDIPVSSTDTYTMSFWSWCYSSLAPLSITVLVRAYNSSSTLLSTAYNSSLNFTNTVTKNTISFTLPANTTKLYISFTTPSISGPTYSDIFTIDALQLEVGTEATDFELSSYTAILSSDTYKIKISDTEDVDPYFSVSSLDKTTSVERLRITGIGDVSLNSISHPFQINGNQTIDAVLRDTFLKIDANEIQTLYSYNPSDAPQQYRPNTITINAEGGNINFGTGITSTTYAPTITIGNNTGSSMLKIWGTTATPSTNGQSIQASGDIATTGDMFAQQFRSTGTGSASEVLFGFQNDTNFDSGIYYVGQNSWAMSNGGTERLKFISSGSIILHGGDNLSDAIPAAANAGAAILYSGQIIASVQVNGGTYEAGGQPLTLQRSSDTAALRDGNLVMFYRQGVVQGTISVTSTVVDYNSFAGSHWSQFKDNEMLDIYRGTVLELIDEKCEWYDSDGNLEENEQLMKVKISDTEASSGVYGVFHRYESEDQNNPNDMRVMSLGAYIIRVSAGETVSIGDLLESDGNGCARVQNDSLIKSSTIAKVTGTTPVETYPDGSYTIPCVLYCG